MLTLVLHYYDVAICRADVVYNDKRHVCYSCAVLLCRSKLQQQSTVWFTVLCAATATLTGWQHSSPNMFLSFMLNCNTISVHWITFQSACDQTVNSRSRPTHNINSSGLKRFFSCRLFLKFVFIHHIDLLSSNVYFRIFCSIFLLIIISEVTLRS